QTGQGFLFWLLALRAFHVSAIFPELVCHRSWKGLKSSWALEKSWQFFYHEWIEKLWMASMLNRCLYIQCGQKLQYLFSLEATLKMAKDDTDFPEPDSPTMPNISFSNNWYEMACITSFFPKEMERFSTVKIGFLAIKYG